MESLASIETITPDFSGHIFSRAPATSLVERSFTPFKSTPSLSEICKTIILLTIVAPKNSKKRCFNSYIGERQPLAYCVEEVDRQQVRKVSDLQTVGDRSIAAVLVSLGWQNF